MKVLFLTNLPSPYRVDFFNELGKKCDLTVLYERKAASNRDSKWNGSSTNTYKEKFLKGANIGEESSLSLEVIKYLKDKRYTHIVISGYGTHTAKIAIIWLTIHRRKFAMNVDGGLIKEKSGLKYCIKKFFVSKANIYLSASKSTVEYLVHYGAKRDRCFIYKFTSLLKKDIIESPYSNEYKLFLRKKLSMKESKIVVTVGQFIHRKGFDVLLNAISLIKGDVGFYIIGGKPTQDYLKIIQEKNIKNVYFLEFMEKEKLSQFYTAADLFVLPTREDIWGLVINEAMAKALPVITTNMCVAGQELIKNNENGFIIKSEDINQLSDAINKVLNDEKRLIEMSKKSLEVIKPFTIENMANESFDIIKKL